MWNFQHQRRLLEELNLSCELKYLFKFQYQAQYDSTGAEHELCSVYLGHVLGKPMPEYNPTEISDTAWVPIVTVNDWLSDPKIPTTPWFAMEWQRLITDYGQELRLS